MELKSVKHAGVYAVVHFGSAECPSSLPLFMKEDGSFTMNMKKAHLTTYRDDVEISACKRNEVLKADGSIMSGRIAPVSILVAPVDYETKRFELRDGVEDMSFWWFTFGVAHPLADMVQGVYATSEAAAREVMVEFYSRNWCSCYKSKPPYKDEAEATVDIGGCLYRPLPKFIKEGDRYQ